MEDLKFILFIKRKEVSLAVIIWCGIQLILMYVYNFLSQEAWIDAVRNLASIMNLIIVVFTPYWFVDIMVNQRDHIPKRPFWLLGVATNGLLLMLFLFFGVIDFLIKFTTVGEAYPSSYGAIILIGSAAGTIIILALGALSASISGSRKKK